MRKILILSVILIFSVLDWAALHDILKQNETNYYSEYLVIILSVLYFSVLVYFKAKKSGIFNKFKL